jgi:hypothetical protein
MKTSGRILLYISENEDFELWRVLCQISPDERAALVKSALKRALLPASDGRNANSNLADTWLKPNNARRIDKNIEENPPAERGLQESGYFSQTAAADENTMRPFQALATEGRGMGRENPASMPKAGDHPGEDNLLDLELEDIFQSPPTPLKGSLPGLNFLLNNVIGEENDEKVIDFIRSNRPASGEDS